MDILDITEANFKAEVLEAKIPVLVDFWAPWCGPCRTMSVRLKEAAAILKEQGFAGKIKIVKVNTDDCKKISSTYGIRSIPTIMLFKNGEAVYNKAGLHTADDITKLATENTTI